MASQDTGSIFDFTVKVGLFLCKEFEGVLLCDEASFYEDVEVWSSNPYAWTACCYFLFLPFFSKIKTRKDLCMFHLSKTRSYIFMGFFSVNHFHSQDAKGNDVGLSTYKGKVLLIVNVASKWYILLMCFTLVFVAIIVCYLEIIQVLVYVNLTTMFYSCLLLPPITCIFCLLFTVFNPCAADWQTQTTQKWINYMRNTKIKVWVLKLSIVWRSCILWMMLKIIGLNFALFSFRPRDSGISMQPICSAGAWN